MKPIQILAVLTISLISTVCLTSCAPDMEEDADSVADTAVKGLMGQGTVTSDKPMKDSFGSEYR